MRFFKLWFSEMEIVVGQPCVNSPWSASHPKRVRLEENIPQDLPEWSSEAQEAHPHELPTYETPLRSLAWPALPRLRPSPVVRWRSLRCLTTPQFVHKRAHIVPGVRRRVESRVCHSTLQAFRTCGVCRGICCARWSSCDVMNNDDAVCRRS